MSIDKEIVEDFVSESKILTADLLDLLEGIEGDFSQVSKLADFGNNVDRIMGGAKSLALQAPADHAVHLIADYATLCKAVGYKGSQIKNNPQLYDICVALLLDATETLNLLFEKINEKSHVLKAIIPEAFIERLRWISGQFGSNVSSSVGVGSSPKLQQTEIDDILKKMGL